MNAIAAANNDALDVLRLLGHVHLRHGRVEAALALLRALDVLEPLDLASQRARVRAEILAGHPGEALRVLDHLRDNADPSPVLWLLQGQALAAMGRSSEAREALQRFRERRDRPVEREK